MSMLLETLPQYVFIRDPVCTGRAGGVGESDVVLDVCLGLLSILSLLITVHVWSGVACSWLLGSGEACSWLLVGC